jgi:hypothetical protein
VPSRVAVKKYRLGLKLETGVAGEEITDNLALIDSVLLETGFECLDHRLRTAKVNE